MGYALAEEAATRGANVVLISGPTQLTPPLKAKTIRVQSAEEMLNAVLQEFDSADFVIKTAAVSDFQPAEFQQHKKKKTGQQETIHLKPTPDILKTIANRKQKQILVGFCADTEKLEENARKKLQSKNLDFIVGNLVSADHDPFQSDSNQVLILDQMGVERNFNIASKREIASQIWDYILERIEKISTETVNAGS